MSKVCELCGKRVTAGRQYARRGMAKYKGGAGQKITGIRVRDFKPNLQKVRALVNGSVKRIRVCTKCIKSDKIIKPGPRSKAPTTPAELPAEAPAETTAETSAETSAETPAEL